MLPAVTLLVAIVVGLWVAWRYFRSKRLPLSTNDDTDGDKSSNPSERVTRPVMWGMNVFLFVLWVFYFQVCNKAFAVFPCLAGTWLFFILLLTLSKTILFCILYFVFLYKQ
jgi:hypothetical protein